MQTSIFRKQLHWTILNILLLGCSVWRRFDSKFDLGKAYQLSIYNQLNLHSNKTTNQCVKVVLVEPARNGVDFAIVLYFPYI